MPRYRAVYTAEDANAFTEVDLLADDDAAALVEARRFRGDELGDWQLISDPFLDQVRLHNLERIDDVPITEEDRHPPEDTLNE
jgi:hypothetical protein